MNNLCIHPHQTLVRHECVLEDLYLQFTAYQCDDCGILTRRDVDTAVTPVAKLDERAYVGELATRIRSLFHTTDNAMKFLDLALQRR